MAGEPRCEREDVGLWSVVDSVWKGKLDGNRGRRIMIKAGLVRKCSGFIRSVRFGPIHGHRTRTLSTAKRRTI